MENTDKIIEFKTVDSEQAFDMLPYVADIYDKIDFDKYRQTLVKKYKGKKTDGIDPMIDVAKFILRNSGKIKTEFFNIVAIAEKRKLEEVKRQSPVRTMRAIKSIFSDPELVDFFKSAME